MNWIRVATQANRGSFASGVVQGAWGGVKALASDVAALAKAGHKVVTDKAYREQAIAKAAEAARAARNFGGRAARDPLGTGERVWNKAKIGAAQARQAFIAARDAAEREGRLTNFYGQVVGRGGFEVGALLVPVAKLGLAGKGAKGAAAVIKAPAAPAKWVATATKAERLKRLQRGLGALPKTKVGAVAECPKAAAARAEMLRAEHAAKIKGSSTFKPKGVSKQEVREYLEGPAGTRYLALLKANNPTATNAQVRQWAITALRSGKTVPRHLTTEQTMLKIVPKGQFKETTPFWTTQAELQKVIDSGRPLNEAFGLPMASDSPVYEIYRATPKSGRTPDVFKSIVAPTVELNGLEKRSGGAVQYLIPDRGAWDFSKSGMRVKNQGGFL